MSESTGLQPARARDDAQVEICRRIMAGESLADICKTQGLPSTSTVFRWLAGDENFRRIYAEAREVQATLLADEIIQIADDARNDWMERQRQDGSVEEVVDHEHIQRSKLRIDARKWMAAKLAPKKYGDRTLVGSDPDNPLPQGFTVNLVKAGDAAG